MRGLSTEKTSQLGRAELSAVLLDANCSRAAVLKRALHDCGYCMALHIQDDALLMQAVDQCQPDFLIVGIDLPDDEVLSAIAQLNDVAPLTVVMFAEKDTPQIIQKSVTAGVSAFVVDDIQPSRLSSIIHVAMARFDAQQLLKNELLQTRTKLEERKLLDKAKGLLMQQKGLSEDQAYKSLRKMSMDKGQSMGAVARNIIDVFALID